MTRILAIISVVMISFFTNVACHTSPTANKSDETLISELLEVERQYYAASINGDKEAMSKILADDYKTQYNDKQSLLNSVEKRPAVKIPSFEHPTLARLTDDSVAISYDITTEGREGYKLTNRYVDKFVWRDNRWQLSNDMSKTIDVRK